MANQRANYMLAPRSSEIRRQHGASIDSVFEDIPMRESLFKRVKSKLSNIGKSLMSAIFRDPSLPMAQESEDYNRISGFKLALISSMPSRPSQQDKSTSAPTPVKNSAKKRKPQEDLKPRPPPVNFFKLPAKPVTSATSAQTKEEPPKPTSQPLTRRGRPGPVLPRELVEKKDSKVVQEIRGDLSRNQIMSQAYEAAFYDLNFKTLEEIAKKKQANKPESPPVSQEPKPAKKLEITTQSLINFESKPMEVVETTEEQKETESATPTDLIVKSEKNVEKVPGNRSTPTQQSARISFFAEDKQDVLFDDSGFIDSELEEPEKTIPTKTLTEPSKPVQTLKPIEILTPTSPHFGKLDQTVFPFQQVKSETTKIVELPQEKPQKQPISELPKFGFQLSTEALKSPEKPSQPPSATLQLSPQPENPFLNSSAIKTSQISFVFGSASQQSNPYGSSLQSSNPFGSNVPKPIEAPVPTTVPSNLFQPVSSNSQFNPPSSGSNPFTSSSTNIKPNPFGSSTFSSGYSTSTQPPVSSYPKQDASGDIEMNSTPTASPKLAPANFPATNTAPFSSNMNPFSSSYQPTVLSFPSNTAPPFPSNTVTPFPSNTVPPFPGGSLGSNSYGSTMPFPAHSTNVQSGNNGTTGGPHFSLGVIPQQRRILKAKRP